MPIQPLSIPFPRGGVVRNLPFSEQQLRTTPDALNIWPARPSDGRLGGGTRPDLISIGAVGSNPCHWTTFAYKGAGGTFGAYVVRVTAVVSNTGGTKISADGQGSWTSAIATSPASDFCSVAAFRQILFQASSGTTNIYYKDYGNSTTGTLASPGAGHTKVGDPPENAGAICTWGGRLLVAGIEDEPHVVRGSAIGDPWNWDESSPDLDSAFGTTGAGDARISDPIVAVFAHNHDCAFVSGLGSSYVLRGNPLANGFVAKVSSTIGAISMSAIAKATTDDTYLLTRIGPHIMQAGCGSPLIPIGGSVPNDLIGVDPADGHWGSLCFDARWRMMHFITNKSGGDPAYWAYQIDDKSWWPMDAPSTMRLGIEIPGIANDNIASALYVDTDGDVYNFDRTDSEELITSYYDVGPFDLADSPNMTGMLVRLNCELADGSDPVYAAVYTGASRSEAAKATTPVDTYTFDREGYNIDAIPRFRDKACRVRLSCDTDQRMSVEQLLPTVATVGGRRAE